MKTSSTTPVQNNEPHVVNAPLHEMLPTQMVVPVKEMEKIWTTLSPFQKEEALLEAICEPSVLQAIEVLVETKMVASRVKLPNEKERNETS